MRKIIPLIFSIFSTYALFGQANGGWGTCEFTTVAAMNAFDPSGSNFTCKKVFVQATDEHYQWDGTAWVLISPVENIYTTDNTLQGDRVVTLANFDLHWDMTGTGDFEVLDNGTVAFTVKDNGLVGIGNITPVAPIHIYEATGTTPSASDGTILLEHGDSGGESSIVFKSNVDSGSDYGYISFSDDGSGNGSTNQNSLLTIGVENEASGNSNVDDIAIMPSGSLGVGTIAPQAKLDVDGGSVRFSDYGNGTYNTGNETYYLGVDADGDILEIAIEDVNPNLYNTDDTLTSNRILEGDSKNLTFTGLGSYILSSISSTFRATTNLVHEADKDNNGTGEHQFYTGTTEKMTIENSGTIDLLQYGDGTYEDNTTNTFDLAVDANGNVIEVDRRVSKINTATLSYSSDQNNLALSGLTAAPYYEVYRINPTNDIDITGINATGVKDGQRLTLMNISSSKKFKIKTEDSGSSAANRIICDDYGDEDVKRGSSITLIYDATSSRWRVYAFAKG